VTLKSYDGYAQAHGAWANGPGGVLNAPAPDDWPWLKRSPIFSRRTFSPHRYSPVRQLDGSLREPGEDADLYATVGRWCGAVRLVGITIPVVRILVHANRVADAAGDHSVVAPIH